MKRSQIHHSEMSLKHLEAGLSADDIVSKEQEGAAGKRRRLWTVRQCFCGVIHHDSRAYKIWWGFTLVCVLATLAALPLQLAFFWERDWMVAFSTALDGCFAVDVLVNLRLTYEDATTNRLVDGPGEIARRYAATLLVPDVLAIIPFDELKPSLALLGLLRFLRLRRVLVFFRSLEGSVHVERGPMAVAKFFALLLINAHTAGCLMHYAARNAGFDAEGTMLGRAGYHPGGALAHEGVSQRYITCVYWAVTTLTTVGYGDLSPVSTIERAVVSAYMLFNLGVTAYLLGTFASMASKDDESTSRQRHRLVEMQRYASRHPDTPASLLESMRRCACEPWSRRFRIKESIDAGGRRGGQGRSGEAASP